MSGHDLIQRWGPGAWQTGGWDNHLRADLRTADDKLDLPVRVTVLTSYTWTDPAALRTAGQILTDAADALAEQQATAAAEVADDEQPTLWEATA